MQVIRGRAISVYAVGPLLLKRDTEQRNPACLVSHHIQKLANADSFLNLVGQVEMGIVELIIATLRPARGSVKRKSATIVPAKSERLADLDASPFMVVPRICSSK